MPAYEFDGVRPVVDPTAYVHPTTVLIGYVHIGLGCYVGPLASRPASVAPRRAEETA